MPLYNDFSNADIRGSNNNNCKVVNSTYTAIAGDIILATPSNSDVKIALPQSPNPGDKVEVYLETINSLYHLYFNTSGSKFKGNQLDTSQVNQLQVTKGSTRFSLVYNADTGWVDYPTGGIIQKTNFTPGMSLWLGGSLTDLSGNSNNASTVGTVAPSQVTGLDNQPVLRWSGGGNQELTINPFLTGTSAATLYIVFTVSQNTNYNLVRTSNLDDYWRFAIDGNGYIGTFLGARCDQYPGSMPQSGNHLISIHANANNYEVLLDNVSKTARNYNYNSGDRFRIGTNDKPFGGDIGTLLVYPSLIDKNSNQHSQNIQAFQSLYPSLSLS